MGIADAPGMLTDRLEGGERLTWWGRPQQGLMLRKLDWFQIPFALFWLNIVIGAQRAGLGFTHAFAILFILAGIWFGGGRLFYDAWRRSRTVYGLSSNRVVIATPSSSQMIDFGNLGEIGIRVGESGRGSIVFGPAPPAWNVLRWSTTPLVPTFEGIDEVRRVLSMIHAARAAGFKPETEAPLYLFV